MYICISILVNISILWICWVCVSLFTHVVDGAKSKELQQIKKWSDKNRNIFYFLTYFSLPFEIKNLFFERVFKIQFFSYFFRSCNFNLPLLQKEASNLLPVRLFHLLFLPRRPYLSHHFLPEFQKPASAGFVPKREGGVNSAEFMTPSGPHFHQTAVHSDLALVALGT